MPLLLTAALQNQSNNFYMLRGRRGRNWPPLVFLSCEDVLGLAKTPFDIIKSLSNDMLIILRRSTDGEYLFFLFSIIHAKIGL